MKSLAPAVSKEPTGSTRLQGRAGYSRVNTMSLREKIETPHEWVSINTKLTLKCLCVFYSEVFGLPWGSPERQRQIELYQSEIQ